MATPTFTAQLGLPDPSAAPLTVTELVTLLNALFLPVSVGNYNAQIVTGSSTPGVGDQDKLWFRSDNSGNPLGFYTFVSGVWRPIYSGRLGQITMFSGSPFGFFETSGRAIAGTTWDGWALCNGNNGTQDLRNRFIAGGDHYDLATAIPAWHTTVSGGEAQIGGAVSHTVTESDLPAYDPTFSGAEFDAGSSQALNRLIIDSRWVNFPQTIPGSNAGDVHYGNTGSQTDIPTVPPFFCLAFVQFVGY